MSIATSKPKTST